MAENNISKILVQAGVNKIITPDEFGELVNGTREDGSYLLSEKEPQFLIDAIDLLITYGFEYTIQYLHAISSDEDNLVSTPRLENQRIRVQMEIDNQQKKIEAEQGIYTCERCRGNETISVQKQIRSADEGMSTIVKCLTCGLGWRID